VLMRSRLPFSTKSCKARQSSTAAACVTRQSKATSSCRSTSCKRQHGVRDCNNRLSSRLSVLIPSPFTMPRCYVNTQHMRLIVPRACTW
jgi:hypothetical protein